MQPLNHSKLVSAITNVFLHSLLLGLLYACGGNSEQAGNQMETPEIPVLEVKSMSASTYRDIPATLEGKVNVELRPQVDGYLEKIYIDEGAFVTKGQPLFQINEAPYREQLHTAEASLLAAKASVTKAKLEVDRLTPLVQNKVVSEIQLQSAQAAYEAAKANEAQAQAMVSSARINLGYTHITAPVSGYIGRIPYKTGSLVGRSEPQSLTVLSDVNEMYAYFSMSEAEFLQFKERFPGNTIQEKITHLPPVQLVLSDNSLFPQPGKIETLEGQFNKTMGSISFRAVFSNPGGLLRSGNTGKVRMPNLYNTAMVIPQEATFELQDQVLVFTVTDSNKVVSRPVQIADQSGNYYLVGNGIKAGEQIVFAGHNRLRDGALIKPQRVSLDSLLQANPL
ncbi:efflux RND transporter periplasmic adaptor subunit [Cytophagaceae bacterium DM2B3-1]|uniref:Efflux RND transporter periplasmic adaptor subunit n=1 Tax=Xanthocytophaga flava TaxID=3048013 RepID=A0ABT7CTT8_9BACT|nr:efflux RND transporter periplasmic adaptor subunit [Xanthocytophaga flavus]MDJ1497188.1 efflux RND transporter periplasmic adaptor subunit [Xanthocytophaga flavus]